MKPYESYQKTKYDWISKVPSHWERITLRSITRLSDERCGERNDLELLSVYREYGIIKKSSRDDNHNVESLDLSNYKFVDVNYLVMNKMKMWQGSLGVSPYKGIVSPAYIVCKLTRDVNSKYLHILLRSTSFKTFYNRISYGVRVGQWDMRYDDFKQLEIYLPPREEQDQIVRYLDWKLSKINKLIKAKKKQIALLNEQKQAIINKAVTKGLDDTVPMKDSGVDWIGEIPEDWSSKRLKQCFCKRKAGAWGNEPSNFLINLPCVRVADFDYDNLILKNNIPTIRGYTKPQVDNLTLIEKIVLIEKSGGGEKTPVGRAVLLNTVEPTLYANFIEALFVSPEYNCDYMVFLLSAMYSNRVNVRYIKQTTGIQNLNITGYLSENIFIPLLQTQEYIVEYLNCCQLEFNKIIKTINDEIALLSEYKTSLISSVVTGKIDVRDIEIPNFEVETDGDQQDIDENDENEEFEEIDVE